MNKCMIPPDSDGYASKDGKSVVATQLTGGAARYRKDVLGATAQVDCQWTVDQHGHDYLRAFYRTATDNGSKPFTIDLILDGGIPQEYTAYFKPESFSLIKQQGLTYVIAASLEVIPLPIDNDSDVLILSQYNA